jgi:hypothetical protein
MLTSVWSGAWPEYGRVAAGGGVECVGASEDRVGVEPGALVEV